MESIGSKDVRVSCWMEREGFGDDSGIKRVAIAGAPSRPALPLC